MKTKDDELKNGEEIVKELNEVIANMGNVVEENRFLKCEDILGNWWYRDLKTNKDLPLFTTPILGLGDNK